MKATINLRPDQYENKFSSCKVGDNVELSRDCGLFMPATKHQEIKVIELADSQDEIEGFPVNGGILTGRRLMLLVLSPSPVSTNGYTVTNFGPAKCLVTEIIGGQDHES